MSLCEILVIVIVSVAVFVNGWTDAPNAIAGAVSTKAMSYRAAVTLAAACNLSGLLVMGFLNSSVADTVTSLVDFGGGNGVRSLAALLAAMAAVVIFAVAAWYFGIPTSESHALIAALAGASIGFSGSISAGNAAAWKKILAGLFLSLLLGFLFGRVLSMTMGSALKKLDDKTLSGFQILFAGGMAFMHGAQDGQKFVAVFVIAERIAKNSYGTEPVNLREHILVLLFCAVVMALGTSVGGRRIIDTVGTKMVPLKNYESVSADFGGGLCLFAASLTGIPMSTTHVKTAAIAGAVTGKKNPAVIGGMLLAWAITFPACAAMGFVFTKLALNLLSHIF